MEKEEDVKLKYWRRKRLWCVLRGHKVEDSMERKFGGMIETKEYSRIRTIQCLDCGIVFFRKTII